MSQRPLNVPGGNGSGGNGSSNGDGQGPPQVFTCPPCQSFADKVNNLNAEITSLQALLHQIGSGGKAGVLKQIEEKNGELDTAQSELDQCEQQNCPPTTTPPTTIVAALNNAVATVWSDAPGFKSPQTQTIPTPPVKFIGAPGKGKWQVRIETLTIPLSSGGELTLQDGRVAAGLFDPSTGSMSLDIPLKGVPVINTVEFTVNTDDTVTTADGQTISGSRVDQIGNITVVGSKSGLGPFSNNAQIRIQGVLSAWPRS